jgi:Na+/H+-dicarboxylate symporter
MQSSGQVTGKSDHPSRKLSLASRILIGLGLGVLTGLFWGELMSPLQIVSRAYLRLMQMTVIPYVAVSLIAGLGVSLIGIKQKATLIDGLQIFLKAG